MTGTGTSAVAQTAGAASPSLFDFGEAHLIDQAVGPYRVAVTIHIHVAHDVAAARNFPSLEVFGLRIEAHDRVGLGVGFAVPDRSLSEGHAVRHRIRPARRLPLFDLPGRQI